MRLRWNGQTDMFSYGAVLWQYDGAEWPQIGLNRRNRDGELQIDNRGRGRLRSHCTRNARSANASPKLASKERARTWGTDGRVHGTRN
jgi:hypothetical protein